MYEEQKHRLFPRSSERRPVKYSNLYAEWAELDGFVAGLAESALAIRRPTAEEIEPFGYQKLSKELQEIEQEYPEVSRPIVEEFRFLERVLEVLRTLSKEE